LIAYNADSPKLIGYLYHYPATKDNDGNRSVYDWDTGKYLGEILESSSTYNVVGNTNSQGLVIAETTFGGIKELSHQKGAIMDYGSLIYITLQRSSTAREAILTMSDLMDTYGYASTGESFSIADRTGEVWIMEVIGRGNYGLGAVWVAIRIPDGHVSSHANQARIRTFPRDDPDNCLYSDDVVQLARDLGLYRGFDEDGFSFSDTYDPLDFHGVRYGESRVWSIFSQIAQDPNFSETYQDYIEGDNYENRMPLYIKPKELLSLSKLNDLMADHYENNDLNPKLDVGAGMSHIPYRPYPLAWDYNDEQYFSERTVGTSKTGWNFIAKIRLNMPQELSSVLWFAADDSSTSPRFPIYGSSTSIPAPFAGKGPQDGAPSPILKFDITKAFWVQNLLSNFVYLRWNDIYPQVLIKRRDLLHSFEKKITAVDTKAQHLYETDVTEAIRYVTNFSNEAGWLVHNEWYTFFGQLFTKYRDFYTISSNPKDTACQCDVEEIGFDDDWKKLIADQTGSRYKVPSGKNDEEHTPNTIDKLSVM